MEKGALKEHLGEQLNGGLFLLLSVVMDPQHNALGSNNTEILK
jgi:hypothetical protein